MSGLNLFAQLTKVDEEKRLVFGRAVQQVPDKSGELFDYATSKPYFEAWSSEINKAAKAASGTENLGNVRAMHGRVAAGKLVEIDFNDAEKAIDVAAYIADDNEWRKTLDGVYTGFSIGGGYVKKWNVVEDGKSLRAYTAKPNEISLADVPCVPGCTFFEIRKTDGSTAQVDFLTEDQRYEAASAEELEKIAPAENDTKWGNLWDSLGGSHTACAEKMAGKVDDPHAYCQWLKGKAGVTEKMLKVYVNGKEDTGKTILADGCEVGAHHTFGDEEFVIAKIVDDIAYAVPVIDGVVEPEVAGTEADVLKLQAIMEEHKLTVADVVNMTLAKVAEREVTPLQKISASLEELAGIGEEHHVATIAKLLHDMVAESDELEKVGARNSAADKKHIQAIHDASHHLGADCAKEEMAKKTVTSTLDKSLQAAFDELAKRVDELSKVATAPKVALRVVPVSKDQDNGAQQVSNTTDIQPVYDAFGKLDPAATAMKLVHATGGANIIPGKL